LGIMKCELIHSLGWVRLGAPVSWEFSWEASSWFGFFYFVWEMRKSMGVGWIMQWCGGAVDHQKKNLRKSFSLHSLALCKEGTCSVDDVVAGTSCRPHQVTSFVH
jgi:hypothetical protein